MPAPRPGLNTARWQDQCTCPAGYEFADNLCQPCAPDTYNPAPLELSDDWFDDYAYCTPCPPGYTSPPGSTACTPCETGKYRAANQTGCHLCPTGYHALNSSDPTSCVACNESCAIGYSADPCPFNPGLYVCNQCTNLPANATYWAGCLYTCAQGLYASNNSCIPCSDGPCPPGFSRSSCTGYRDSDCSTACNDPAKPLWFSNWTSGCTWACDQGYTLVTKAYPLFSLNECVRVGPSSFWSTLFT